MVIPMRPTRRVKILSTHNERPEAAGNARTTGKTNLGSSSATILGAQTNTITFKHVAIRAGAQKKNRLLCAQLNNYINP